MRLEQRTMLISAQRSSCPPRTAHEGCTHTLVAPAKIWVDKTIGLKGGIALVVPQLLSDYFEPRFIHLPTLLYIHRGKLFKDVTLWSSTDVFERLQYAKRSPPLVLTFTDNFDRGPT